MQDIYVCMYVCIYIYIYTHPYIYIYVHSHIHSYAFIIIIRCCRVTFSLNRHTLATVYPYACIYMLKTVLFARVIFVAHRHTPHTVKLHLLRAGTPEQVCGHKNQNTHLYHKHLLSRMHACAYTHTYTCTQSPMQALEKVMNSETEESATRIRATLASANLCGREERSILSTAPAMLREFVLCTCTTVSNSCTGGKKFDSFY
jgi:hypothetical protein